VIYSRGGPAGRAAHCGAAWLTGQASSHGPRRGRGPAEAGLVARPGAGPGGLRSDWAGSPRGKRQQVSNN